MKKEIIEASRSIVVACDFPPSELNQVVKATKDIGEISAYKIGFEVALGMSLPGAVNTIEATDTDKKIIYDHQKAGTDTPYTAVNFARAMRRSGVSAAILYPRLNKPAVVEAWVKELQDGEIGVIVGSEMTDEPIIKNNYQSDLHLPLLHQAAKLGVRDFAVPANKPYRVDFYRKYFDKHLGKDDYSFYGIGFGKQGGSAAEFNKAAPKRAHAIIGRLLIDAANIKLAASKFSREFSEAIS